MNEEKAARLAAIRAANATKNADGPPASRASTRTTIYQAAPTPTELTDPFASLPPGMAPHTLVLVLLASAAGALAAAVVLPSWLPHLSESLLGPEPKAYWYLARASAFVAYGLLWLSMMLGLTMTNKLARVWPGGPVAFDLHQHTSLLGLAFALFHALVLLGDRYIGYSLAQILMPFASTAYKPLEVGLGQIALYLLALVGLSFYVRALIGRKLWRSIHFLSFALFVLALLHGVGSGTDSPMTLSLMFYWASGGTVLFATIYRVLLVLPSPARA
jgi:predicted ferric reductase